MKKTGKKGNRVFGFCTALLLIAALSWTMAFTPTVRADGERNTITVDADSLINKSGISDDISFEMDLYRIAGAKKREDIASYDFTLEDAFSGDEGVKSAFEHMLSLSSAQTDEKTAAAAAKKLADAAALAVKADPGKTVIAGKSAGPEAPKVTFEITGDSRDGIYLILVHGTDGYAFSTAADPEDESMERVVTSAESGSNAYTFFPILVTLPCRTEASGGISWTDDQGPWQFEASIVLKGSITPIPEESTPDETETPTETIPPTETEPETPEETIPSESVPEETTPEETAPPSATEPEETTKPSTVVITDDQFRLGLFVTIAVVSGAVLIILAIVGLSLRKSKKK